MFTTLIIYFISSLVVTVRVRSIYFSLNLTTNVYNSDLYIIFLLQWPQCQDRSFQFALRNLLYGGYAFFSFNFQKFFFFYFSQPRTKSTFLTILQCKNRNNLYNVRGMKTLSLHVFQRYTLSAHTGTGNIAMHVFSSMVSRRAKPSE